MHAGFKIGDEQTLATRVGAEHAIELRCGAADEPGVYVFSTPAMILLMELAAKALLEPYLEPGEQSVGAEVDVKHLAATPLGGNVRGTARLIRIDGRQFEFEVAAYDEHRQIGVGRHLRAVVEVGRVRRQLEEQQPTAVASPLTAAPTGDALPRFQTLRLEAAGPVLTATLHRPEKLNAVDSLMTTELEQLTGYLAAHPELRLVLLTGAGRAFCAGDDVAEVGRLTLAEAEQLSHRQARLYLSWEQLPQVMIAVVNGPALGGGCVAACACDFRIAAVHAQFGMPEILLGWPPGYGVAQLTALVGKARALQLCLTGQPITASQALEWGLAHRVVPAPQLESEAQKWANQLLQTPPAALRATKRLLHQDEGAQPKIAYLADTAAYIACLAGPEAKEGIAAFQEKRSPRFEG
ncbi:thioesterase, FlK family [Lignipirellula cremea]|uniref:Putative enoyl-CoA hydratase echA8 n=1 Tax=Lignipirellula cremea TaxID=2528010 RepID=A0A518DZN7_9BACT|nr:enoyl-CoA hydratase-related protein [Lignipirellula cremea]QDU97306.1 putative enoyl-CoA hydratase echA8 [Lignipirellula cremea]